MIIFTFRRIESRFFFPYGILTIILSFESPVVDSTKNLTWCKADLTAKEIIGLTISDSHLEQVRHTITARSMWKKVCDIYERRTLSNNLDSRRKLHTAIIKYGKYILELSARTRKLASTLKSMGVIIGSNKIAMALLNGLQEQFDSIINAVDAVGDDDQLFTFDFVLSRCEQEEQRQSQRHFQAISKL